VNQSSPNFFVERGRERCSASGFQILNISIHFEDIHTQSWKLSEIAPNLAGFFAPQIFLGADPQIFGPAFTN